MSRHHYLLLFQIKNRKKLFIFLGTSKKDSPSNLQNFDIDQVFKNQNPYFFLFIIFEVKEIEIGCLIGIIQV